MGIETQVVCMEVGNRAGRVESEDHNSLGGFCGGWGSGAGGDAG